MSDHAHYEELTALAAGGHLSQLEDADLRRHLESCAECRESLRVYRDLVSSGLPLASTSAADATGDASADPGMTARFVERARREGVRFSPEVDQVRASHAPSWRTAALGLAAAAALVLAVVFTLRLPSSRTDVGSASVDQ